MLSAHTLHLDIYILNLKTRCIFNIWPSRVHLPQLCSVLRVLRVMHCIAICYHSCFSKGKHQKIWLSYEYIFYSFIGAQMLENGDISSIISTLLNSLSHILKMQNQKSHYRLSSSIFVFSNHTNHILLIVN